MRARSLSLAFAVALGCTSKAGDTGPDLGGDGGVGTDATAPVGLDEFFSLAEIHTIDINVDQAGVDGLIDSPRVYVEGDVAIDAAELGSVGVRLKGGYGSFVPLDAGEDGGEGKKDEKWWRPPKPAFIIDFNRFVSGQEHLGLRKLTLNNLVQDPTGIHEFVGYALFREGAVPAPRSGWAQVSFNGEEKGLYALIETPDNPEFLDRWYGTNEGNLYEGAYGTDLYAEQVSEFDHDHGDDPSLGNLATLVEALDSAGENPDAVLAVLDDRFDLDEYLTFAATELFLGHWDGYAWTTNNYFVHYEPNADKWTFLPWGIDQLFQDGLGGYAGVMQDVGPAWTEVGGRIHSMCFLSAGCRTRLFETFQEVLNRVDEMDLARIALDARELVEPLVLAEAAKRDVPWFVSWVSDSLYGVVSFIRERKYHIGPWLACLEGDTLDWDEDSYDDCTQDCRYWDPEIHPGAAEQCNFVDDDCNGVIDDPAECPKCMETTAPDSITYSICFESLAWDSARAYCQDRGQELGSFHDSESAEWVAFTLLEEFGMEASWIGLSDRDAEGEFVWTDGSMLDFTHWLDDAPSPDPQRDCVVALPWGWFDFYCDIELPFICR